MWLTPFVNTHLSIHVDVGSIETKSSKMGYIAIILD